jgi:CBS domain-containing protein
MGIITDRDIVVKGIAKDKNPAEVKVGDLIEEAHHLWWIDADADIDEVVGCGNWVSAAPTCGLMA